MRWKKLLHAGRTGGKNNQVVTPDQLRSEFERDYDRLIFSHPFRRLQDKTQVFPIPEHDFVHNRLTHSLEVSVVGRSIGRKVGQRVLRRHPELKDWYTPADFGSITAAACLAHDLGNPPFGHSGEESISCFFKSRRASDAFRQHMSEKEWSDLTCFEGNAQGFRMLNNPHDRGLRLTIATLAAFTKYPHGSLLRSRIADRKSQKKYGYFQNEQEAFEEVAVGTGLIKLNDESYCRHPLVFLVEAADDICYHIIDLEDGCRLGLVDYPVVRDLLARILGDQYQADKLEKIYGENEKISLLRAMAINKLVDETVEVFMENEEDILLGHFDHDLISKAASEEVLEDIKKLSVKKLYCSRTVTEKEIGGFEVLNSLLDAFCFAVYNRYEKQARYDRQQDGLFRLLPENTQHFIDLQNNLYQRMLYITDFISGLTDRHAVSLFKKIKGISLPIT